MIKKILIANRGEIAVRIIRAARELNIKTVAVHSEVDVNSLHVQLADESVCIGKNRAKQSYLNTISLLSACDISGADAVHPGYGFLSEDSNFAEAVEKCGLKFIGPSSETMKKMSSKIQSRAIAEKAGVPILKGSEKLTTLEEAQEFIIGQEYPLLIKASYGGGGRGMRVVHKKEDFQKAFESAQNEALAAFGNGTVFIEKFLEKPRHIEIQLIADEHGKILHLGERECSLQRRHQKIIEECPSPNISEETREAMGKAACKLAKAVQYTGVGTVEFLVDDKDSFYFMEMNTRIQVEHPVTEEVYRFDLVKEQLKIAQGEKISLNQKDMRIQGHSIECRINAEDAYTFIPSPGKIEQLILPGGPNIRVDSGVYSGSQVPPFYDSLLFKIISIGKDRNEALVSMKRALQECIIEGIKCNKALHEGILASSDFQNNDVYTTWIEDDFLNRKN